MRLVPLQVRGVWVFGIFLRVQLRVEQGRLPWMGFHNQAEAPIIQVFTLTELLL